MPSAAVSLAPANSVALTPAETPAAASAQPANAPAAAPVTASLSARIGLPAPQVDRVEPAMLSENSGLKVSAAFDALAESALLRDPEMVERLTRELLRPMIKTWLDDNLPNVVERLVRAEIERVGAGRGGRRRLRGGMGSTPHPAPSGHLLPLGDPSADGLRGGVRADSIGALIALIA